MVSIEISATAKALGVQRDKLDDLKRKFHQGDPSVTLDQVRSAARTFLQMRAAAEEARFGRAKTKVSDAAIAALLR